LRNPESHSDSGVRKAQPEGGESGLGNSPVSTIRSRALAASTRGTAENSASV
jgi:hypothetical protein